LRPGLGRFGLPAPALRDRLNECWALFAALALLLYRFVGGLSYSDPVSKPA